MSNTKNVESFDALVNKYQRPIYQYVLKILRNREDAEEATQDAFVKAYRTLTKFDVQPPYYAKVRGWLFKIALNVARSRLSKKRVEQVDVDSLSDLQVRHSALEDRSTPDAILDRQMAAEVVERAICGLPRHLLETARLRFVDGLMPSEIAARCSQPLGTVKTRLFRAKCRLRQLLLPAFGAAL